MKKNKLPWIPLRLQPFAEKVDQKNGRLWDPTRRKWLVAQPEEWVRQAMIRYLMEMLGCSPAKMRSEFEFRFNKLPKRVDLVVFDRVGDPWILIECKSWKVELGEKVLKQVGIYNAILRAPYVVVCNGNASLWAQQDFEQKTTKIFTEIPKLEL